MNITNFMKYELKMSNFNKIDKNRVLSFLPLILILLSMDINAQNTITLSQAIRNGLASKNNIAVRKLELAMNKLQTQALYCKYWPELSAEYNYLYNPILQTSILPIGIFNPAYPPDATKSVRFGTKWTQSAGLTANQPLFDLSIKRKINESKLQEKITALSQEQSEYELSFTIAQAYIDIYLTEAKIKTLIADTNRTYISYMLLKNKFDEHRLLKSDLNKSKVNHNNGVQLLMDEMAQLIEDKVSLLFLMGVNDLEKWDFEIDTSFAVQSNSIYAVSPIHTMQLPDLQQLTTQSQLSNLQAESEKAKHIPTIHFKGFLGVNQFSNIFNPIAANSWFGLSYVGLDVKVPLLFGENLNNKIQQLKLKSDQYNLQEKDKILEYTKDMYTAKLKMDNLKAQLKILKENISLSNESVDIFQARVREGQESASNLNSEEASLQLMEADYETRKKQYWIYWLNYLKASGQLTILWK